MKKIVCRSDEMVIDENNRLWPCCYTNLYKWSSTWQKNQDKDWNNLDKYSYEVILNNEGFTKHYNEEHWQDDTKCDEICKKYCSVNEKRL
jgi:hypothetical protein